jgi:hypothetical protein
VCKEPGISAHSLADLCFDDLILTKKNSNKKYNLSKSKTVNLLARNASDEAILLFTAFKTAVNILVFLFITFTSLRIMIKKK